MRLRLSTLLVTGCLGLAACGRGAPPPVSGTLERVRRALEAADADALYALSTSETRAVHGLEGVRQLVERNREELEATARLLDDVPLELSLSLHFERGEPVALRYEDGGYRLDGALLAGTSLESPEGAVLSLRAALERRSLPGILRVLTTGRSRALLAELSAIADAARDPLDYDVKATEDEAIVRLPGGAIVFLERESGEWRVVDVTIEDAAGR